MRQFCSWLALTLAALLCAWHPASAQEPAVGKMTVKQLERIGEILQQEINVEKVLSEKRLLGDFLAELEKTVPTKIKLQIKLDKATFGKVFVDPAKLKHFGVESQFKMPLIMSLALAKIATVSGPQGIGEVDAGPGYFQIVKSGSEPFWEVNYDIKQLVARAGAWKPLVLSSGPKHWTNLATSCLVGEAVQREFLKPGRWYKTTVQGTRVVVINSSKLIVTTTWAGHNSVLEWLDSLMSFAEQQTAAVRADLLEINAALYAKKIVPLLKSDGPHRAAVPIMPALYQELKKLPVAVEGEEVKVVENTPAVVLSLKKAITHVGLAENHPVLTNSVSLLALTKKGAGPIKLTPRLIKQLTVEITGDVTIKKKIAEPEYQAAIVGVSFTSQVQVAPNRASLKLTLTQQATDLVGMKKTTILNPATAQPVEVEIPTIRTTHLSADLDLKDGQAVVMPCAYQTPEAKAKDRVLVLLLTATTPTDEKLEAIKKLMEKPEKGGK